MLDGVRHNTVVRPGGVIQVQADDLPIGQAVEVIVRVPDEGAHLPLSHPLQALSHEERLAKIQGAIGDWENDAEISAIFSEMERDRHTYQGRTLHSFDE